MNIRRSRRNLFDRCLSRSNPDLCLIRTIVWFFLTQGSRSSIDSSLLNFNSPQHGFVLISHLLCSVGSILCIGRENTLGCSDHLMEYLEAHPSFELTYLKRSALSNGLTGFADSDWAMSLCCRSTTGNLFLYNRSPISWQSKLQKMIALSTASPKTTVCLNFA